MSDRTGGPAMTRYTREEMLTWANLLILDADSNDYGHGGAVQVMRDAAAMLRQASEGVPRCGTCEHFSVDPNYNALPVGVCDRNHSYGWPSDGSGFCHMHQEAQR